MDRVKHDDDSDGESIKQGFDLLLGGSVDLDATAWDNEEEISDQEEGQSLLTALEEPKKTAIKINLDTVQAVNNVGLMMERVHACTPQVCGGRFVDPPVRVVNLSDQNNRGNSLVATKRINMGQVILTERAAFATQLPSSGCLAERSAWTCVTYPIRACQHCFRSMESISSLSRINNDTSNSPLPLPHLWPMPEYNQDDDHTREDGLYRMDPHGRVQCTECSSLFCNKFCRIHHCQEFKSCCDCLRAVAASNADEDMQPAVILACRIFASFLHKYRQGLVNEDDSLLLSSPLNSLCGDASDIQQLELGKVCQDSGDSYYTLQSTYDNIAEGLHMTSDERVKLNLQLLEQIASIVARNSFDIATQSPSSEYHGALLRAAGGRGTEPHAKLMKQVAKALGSPDCTLQRDMDKHVEEMVCFVRWVWNRTFVLVS
jgi:hypothetical protein